MRLPLSSRDSIGHAGHDHGTVAIADARSAGHQHILVGNIRVGVVGDGAQVVEALHGLAVEGFDVRQYVTKGHRAERTFLRRQSA